MDAGANPSTSTFPATEVRGFSERTNNAVEMSSGDGRIPALWVRFDQQIAPRLNQGGRLFGVYSNYESDDRGDFDVLVGTDQKKLEPVAELVLRTIPAVRYLVFPARGKVPQSIIRAWRQVWAYFQSNGCLYQRAYTTDFELYTAKDRAELYIAVK